MMTNPIKSATSDSVSGEERGKPKPELDDVTDRWFQDFIYRARLTAKQSQELRERLNRVKVKARDKTVEIMFSNIYAAINDPPDV